MPTATDGASQVIDVVAVQNVTYEPPMRVAACREVEILLDGALGLDELRALPNRAVYMLFMSPRAFRLTRGQASGKVEDRSAGQTVSTRGLSLRTLSVSTAQTHTVRDALGREHIMTGRGRYTSAKRRSLPGQRHRFVPSAARVRSGVLPRTITAVILWALVPTTPALAQFGTDPGPGPSIQCDPTAPRGSGQCDDNDACTYDWCDDGTCVNDPLTGDVCEDDGTLCTDDLCEAGICTHIENDDCCDLCDDGNPCTDDFCVDGACDHLPNSVGCDDGNACTEDEICADGVCSGTGIDCDDHSACTLDGCDPGAGCVYENVDCDDDCECTDDTCVPSTGCVHSVGCDDWDACTIGFCSVLRKCKCEYKDIDCDDGNACTNDGCNAQGSCYHTPNHCNDGDPCTADICWNGSCTNQYEPDCTECPAGWCFGLSCEAETCSVSVDDGTACPGGSVELDLIASCWPDCGSMSFGPDPTNPPPPGVTVTYPAGIFCAPKSQPRTLLVEIDPDMPPGPVTIYVIGTTELGAECPDSATVTVEKLVNLVFAGVSDEDESDPGGFLALNDDDDNDNGIPDKDETGTTTGENDLLDLTVVGSPASTGTVELSVVSGGNRVRFYEFFNRDSPVTLPRTWDVSELPDYVTVEGFQTSASTGDVELKILYTGEGGPCEDRVTLTVVDFDLGALQFTSDHGVLTDEDVSWIDEGTVYTEPEWILGGVNNPISHTKGLPLQVTATLDVRPADLPSRSYTLDGDGAAAPYDFYTEGVIGGGLDQTIALTAGASLPDAVDTIQGAEIEWSIQWSAQPLYCDLDTTGPHKIYVTYGTPLDNSTQGDESTPTEKRVSEVCQWASGRFTSDDVALAIWVQLSYYQPPFFDLAGTTADIWGLMIDDPDNPGQCIHLAKLMQYACGLVGVSDVDIGYCYATTDNDNYSQNGFDQETRDYEYQEGETRTEYLRFRAFEGLNNWEAVCVVNNHYYAVKESHGANTVELIKEIICPNEPTENHQVWTYLFDPADPDLGWVVNTDDQYPAPLPGGCP